MDDAEMRLAYAELAVSLKKNYGGDPVGVT